jgi:hypothetical protein
MFASEDDEMQAVLALSLAEFQEEERRRGGVGSGNTATYAARPAPIMMSSSMAPMPSAVTPASTLVASSSSVQQQVQHHARKSPPSTPTKRNTVCVGRWWYSRAEYPDCAYDRLAATRFDRDLQRHLRCLKDLTDLVWIRAQQRLHSP